MEDLQTRYNRIKEETHVYDKAHVEAQMENMNRDINKALGNVHLGSLNDPEIISKHGQVQGIINKQVQRLDEDNDPQHDALYWRLNTMHLTDKPGAMQEELKEIKMELNPEMQSLRNQYAELNEEKIELFNEDTLVKQDPTIHDPQQKEWDDFYEKDLNEINGKIENVEWKMKNIESLESELPMNGEKIDLEALEKKLPIDQPVKLNMWDAEYNKPVVIDVEKVTDPDNRNETFTVIGHPNGGISTLDTLNDKDLLSLEKPLNQLAEKELSPIEKSKDIEVLQDELIEWKHAKYEINNLSSHLNPVEKKESLEQVEKRIEETKEQIKELKGGNPMNNEDIVKEKYPERNQISDLRAIRSPEGHYVGRQIWEGEDKGWKGHNRVSDYYKTAAHAGKVLGQVKKFKEHIKQYDTDQLKYAYNNLSQNEPETRLKGNVIKDHLSHNKPHEKNLAQEKGQEISR